MTASPRAKIRTLLTTALAAVAFVLSGLLAAPAHAADSPAGCGTPHKVNSAAIVYGVASSSWRIGTLTQYWGWCDSQLRNWAHVHFYEGYSAVDVKVGIQTKAGDKYGVKTVTSGRDFTSRPADTMSNNTRAFVEGTIQQGGGFGYLNFTATGWSG